MVLYFILESPWKTLEDTGTVEPKSRTYFGWKHEKKKKECDGRPEDIVHKFLESFFFEVIKNSRVHCMKFGRYLNWAFELSNNWDSFIIGVGIPEVPCRDPSVRRSILPPVCFLVINDRVQWRVGKVWFQNIRLIQLEDDVIPRLELGGTDAIQDLPQTKVYSAQVIWKWIDVRKKKKKKESRLVPDVGWEQDFQTSIFWFWKLLHTSFRWSTLPVVEVDGLDVEVQAQQRLVVDDGPDERMVIEQGFQCFLQSRAVLVGDFFDPGPEEPVKLRDRSDVEQVRDAVLETTVEVLGTFPARWFHQVGSRRCLRFVLTILGAAGEVNHSKICWKESTITTVEYCQKMHSFTLQFHPWNNASQNHVYGSVKAKEPASSTFWPPSCS